MKALVMESPRNAVIKDVPYPHPGPNEITIQVKRCGICGTDLHIYQGTFMPKYPLIPGHEFAGVVSKTGAHVTKFKIGDRVAVDPSLFCGKCDYCLSGRGNHCVEWGAIGDTVNGAMAEYVKVPEAVAFHMPDGMPFAEGAFIEPIACVVHGMNQLQLRVGQSVLLFGAGSMGQLLIQSLSHAGAGELAVVDVSDNKLEMARKNGATHTFLSSEISSKLNNRKKYAGFDAVIDATGIPQVIQAQLQYLAPSGTHLQFGVAPQDARISVSPFDIYHMDWKLVGSMAVNHTFKPAMDWMAAGRFKTAPLISKQIQLDEVPAFFAQGKAADIMKVQISFE
ncbi:alcohol dehydrogenase catalytic domain-containing protein [Paenibacillus sp. LMG 31456]|uniref:Alcohol dehydrogenase catalytic domain-containing protein n=1 Tax=Paenibacillus foliorum TaxID=2654974 RepID=A0A972GUD8_9BACL|nr:zinc-dependent alcohol dehydrogenase family protein [Paenibacillus foliorum]NOU97039.1 alcohol dehydrogenase catalytic domain-containing protein [Paenibacillus foliorum]